MRNNGKVVSYFYDPEIVEFRYGRSHPMKPIRIGMTHSLLENYGLTQKMNIFRANRASKEDLIQFHDEGYVEFLEQITPDLEYCNNSKLNQFKITGDSPIFDGMYDFCKISAGGSIDGAMHLNHGQSDISINWSGGLHHAKSNQASGFCYINDIVLGIQELLKYNNRVLYIDIDIHHGDGVEEAFKTTDRVMTCSFHKYGNEFFPGTGNLTDIGELDGRKYSVNFPLDDGMNDELYFEYFKKTIDAVDKYYQPNSIVLQCGADTLSRDWLGCFDLTTKGHGKCVQHIRDKNLPLLILGGGGYTPKNVAKCWAYETSLLIDNSELPEELPAHEFSEYYLKDETLYLTPIGMENKNEKIVLDKTFEQIYQNLKDIVPVPSVGNRTRPQDSIAMDENDKPYKFYKKQSNKNFKNEFYDLSQDRNEKLYKNKYDPKKFSPFIDPKEKKVKKEKKAKKKKKKKGSKKNKKIKKESQK
ncbi:histone deacetylase rpd3 [Anaeramoeba flamelloides]|uniref:Histone deacetylase n=1 Tax=Anaeramoeba flamelloides TaxID=1746091 RepID=A0ABQ8X880_9EUKA|nr:histone deacetylase rpd3 [Anaeramoeba flamelloides]